MTGTPAEVFLDTVRDRLVGSDPPSPAHRDLLDRVEDRVGWVLPLDVRLAYSGIANGGYGPASGLVGLGGGYRSFINGRNAYWGDEHYARLVDDGWYDGLLPLLDWGDGTWSCVDLTTEDGDIRRYAVDDDDWIDEGLTFRGWLLAWAAGEDLGTVLRP